MAAQTPADTDAVAYEMKPPTYRPELAEVGRGAPIGELLLRYSRLIGLAADAGSTPHQVRAGRAPPIDDTHYRICTAGRVRSKGGFTPNMKGEARTDKRGFEQTPEHWRERPGDYEAWTGQGSITLHSEEHLVGSDRGIVMLRRQIYRQLRAMDGGEDPMNVSFDRDAPPLHLRAGKWLGEASPSA